MLTLQRTERIALLFGILGFVAGPLVGVFAVVYSMRQLRSYEHQRNWPYLGAIWLAVSGCVVFVVSAALFAKAIIR